MKESDGMGSIQPLMQPLQKFSWSGHGCADKPENQKQTDLLVSRRSRNWMLLGLAGPPPQTPPRISIFCQTFAVRGRPPRQSRKGKGRLGGVEPRYYQQEAVNLFFQRARSIRNWDVSVLFFFSLRGISGRLKKQALEETWRDLCRQKADMNHQGNEKSRPMRLQLVGGAGTLGQLILPFCIKHW